MTDYWNDPPEAPEVPECCEQEMEVLDDGTLVCGVCKHRIDVPWEPQFDSDPLPELSCDDEPRNAGPCRHGNIGPCDQCDYLADIAYDTAREQRMRR